jgi:LysR family transcriptional regulator, low CO2-responsive transcriptional regulator
MLNLQEIEVFLAAAQFGSFSEAGRRLHLSQPAISQTIHSLENRTGLILFDRSGRSVRLSDAGQALIPLARKLMATANRVEEEIALLHDVVAGHVRIGCTTSSGKYLLPGMVARFRRKYPDVRVDILVSQRHHMLNELLNGELEFGLVSKSVEHENLDYVPFYNDSVVLIVPPDHPWAGRRCIDPHELPDMPLIMREQGSGTSEAVCAQLHAYDITMDSLDVAMILGNADAITMAVAEGLGAAFIPRLAADQALSLGQVIEVEIRGMRLRQDLFFVRNRSRPQSRCQTELWQFIKTYQVINRQADPPARVIALNQ